MFGSMLKNKHFKHFEIILPEHKHMTSLTSHPSRKWLACSRVCSNSKVSSAGVQMFQVFQVCVRRQLWSSVSRRFPAAGSAASVPGSGRAAVRQLRSRERDWVRSCTVDPDREEQFVFPDCTGETGTGFTGPEVRVCVVCLCWAVAPLLV